MNKYYTLPRSRHSLCKNDSIDPAVIRVNSILILFLIISDFAMIAVIMGAHRVKMNPDNLATPLAASIGDVVSISVLSFIASKLFLLLKNDIWVLYAILVGFGLLLPLWIWIVLKNRYTRNVLTSGWTPVIIALFISG